jgi:hypothetical protein
MAYQTGTASSAAGLVTIIKDFAASNGFTVTGDVIHSSNSWTRVQSAVANLDPISTHYSSENYNIIGFTGGLDTTFSTNLSPVQTIGGISHSCYNAILTASWPITYYLVATPSSPRAIYGVINYDVNKFQHFAFGEIIKSTSLYTGGNFVTAQFASAYTSINCREKFIGCDLYNAMFSAGVPYFWPPVTNTGNNGARNSFLYLSHNSYGWGPGANTTAAPTTTNLSDPIAIRFIAQLLGRQPNNFNNQTILLPARLLRGVSASYVMDFGELPYFRFCRIDYLNPGDIITLGSDQWKVFPIFQKDVSSATAKRGYGEAAIYTASYGPGTQDTRKGPKTGTFAIALKVN